MRRLSRVLMAALAVITLSCSSHKVARDDSNAPSAAYITRDEMFPGTAPGSGGGILEGAVQAAQAGLHTHLRSLLSGKCLIRESQGDPMVSPCTNLVLILKDDETRAEIARQTCDSQGTFSFGVSAGHRYWIGAIPVGNTRMLKDQGPFTPESGIWIIF